MSKSYRSKPVPGVGDWEKINRLYGGDVNAFYQATSDSDSYHGTYHTLARKYGWDHEPKKKLPAGASQGFSSILNTEKERYETQIGNWNIVINRYGKDDSQVQVLMANLYTEQTASGTMPISQVDQFIAENFWK